MSFSWAYLNVSSGNFINNESLNELYTNVNTLRSRYGLTAISGNYTDGQIVMSTFLTNLRSYYDEMSGKTPLTECTAHYVSHLGTHNSTYRSTHYVTHRDAHYVTYRGTHYVSYLNDHNASYLSENNGTHKGSYFTSHYYAYNARYVSDVQETCVIKGTKVLMSDYTLKNIEDVQIKDKVLGIDGSINEVYSLDCTPLGSRRVLYTFPDKSLYITGEHNIWIRIDGKQQWGVHNIHDWWAEVYNLKLPNSDVSIYKDIISEPYIIHKPVEYANVFYGWKKQYYDVAREYNENTPVYFLYTTNSHTFIANGYIVGGGIDERDFDYKNFYWSESEWKQCMKY